MPSAPAQTNLASWQGPDTLLPRDPNPPALQLQSELAMMPMQSGSMTDVSCETDPSTWVDMTNWSDSAPTFETSPSDWPWLALNDPFVFPTFTASQPTPAFQLGNQPQNDGLGSTGTSDDEGEEGIVPRLAARFGSLRRGPDGRLRYYGTATNHHFLKDFGSLENQIDIQDVREIAFAALESAQLDQEVPASLENHLIELFFAWHNPCHSTVDRSVFEAARAQGTDGQTDFCSQSLIAAM